MISVEELYKLYIKCTGITTDSRKVAEGSMFFALKGDKFDGNNYAEAALQSGAKYAIVDRPSLEGVNIKGKKYCIVVESVLHTLQQLAAYHRALFDIPVVGITGTNGKTTTKELVAAVLSKKYKTVFTQGNFNNHIGVPLTLLNIDETTEVAVVEMGASAPGEIASLVRIVRPTMGIVTNVGRAHLQGFGSFDAVKRTKGELYDYMRQTGGVVFYNGDNPVLCEMLEARKGVVRRKYGLEVNDVNILPATAEEPYLRLEIPSPSGNSRTVLTTHLVGDYNADNVLAAIAVADEMKVPFTDYIPAIENYSPSNNRSQLVRGASNVLIVDAYNANPTSMNAALDNFASLEYEDKTLILGDMLELGDSSETEHAETIKRAKEISNDIYLVGSRFRSAAMENMTWGQSVRCFDNVEALLSHFTENKLTGRMILIKGSHGIGLEKIVQSLVE